MRRADWRDGTAAKFALVLEGARCLTAKLGAQQTGWLPPLRRVLSLSIARGACLVFCVRGSDGTRLYSLACNSTNERPIPSRIVQAVPRWAQVPLSGDEDVNRRTGELFNRYFRSNQALNDIEVLDALLPDDPVALRKLGARCLEGARTALCAGHHIEGRRLDILARQLQKRSNEVDPSKQLSHIAEGASNRKNCRPKIGDRPLPGDAILIKFNLPPFCATQKHPHGGSSRGARGEEASASLALMCSPLAHSRRQFFGGCRLRRGIFGGDLGLLCRLHDFSHHDGLIGLVLWNCTQLSARDFDAHNCLLSHRLKTQGGPIYCNFSGPNPKKASNLDDSRVNVTCAIDKKINDPANIALSISAHFYSKDACKSLGLSNQCR
jgi:hypothetical protein